MRASGPGVPVPPSSDRPTQSRSIASVVMLRTSLKRASISATDQKARAAMPSRWASADHPHPPGRPDAACDFLIRLAPIFFAGKFCYGARRSISDFSKSHDHQTTAAFPRCSSTRRARSAVAEIEGKANAREPDPRRQGVGVARHAGIATVPLQAPGW